MPHAKLKPSVPSLQRKERYHIIHKQNPQPHSMIFYNFIFPSHDLKVFATATEDMDALTFRTPKLLRRFTSSQGKEKQPIIEVDFAAMLAGIRTNFMNSLLKLRFDFCIVCSTSFFHNLLGIMDLTCCAYVLCSYLLEFIGSLIVEFLVQKIWKEMFLDNSALLSMYQVI